MKQQLFKLINCYAAARCSGDPLLQEFAISQLEAFLESVELNPVENNSELSND